MMATLPSFLSLLSLVAAQVSQQDNSFFSLAHHSRCSTFPRFLHAENLTILDAIYYPANAPIHLSNGQATVNTTALPAFCRLVLSIITNPVTGKSAGAELWLPDQWNERLLGFGNGGWGGGGESERDFSAWSICGRCIALDGRHLAFRVQYSFLESRLLSLPHIQSHRFEPLSCPIPKFDTDLHHTAIVDYRGMSLDGIAQGYASYGTDTGEYYKLFSLPLSLPLIPTV